MINLNILSHKYYYYPLRSLFPHSHSLVHIKDEVINSHHLASLPAFMVLYNQCPNSPHSYINSVPTLSTISKLRYSQCVPTLNVPVIIFTQYPITQCPGSHSVPLHHSVPCDHMSSSEPVSESTLSANSGLLRHILLSSSLVVFSRESGLRRCFRGLSRLIRSKAVRILSQIALPSEVRNM